MALPRQDTAVRPPASEERPRRGEHRPRRGETDTWTLLHAGFPALGIPGASSWQSSWTIHVKDIRRVYLWHEPDGGGDNLAAKILPDIPEVLLIEPPSGIKDINDLWLSSGCDVGIFRERMEVLIASARPLSAIKAEALTERAREMLTASEGFLDDPALLHRMVLASEAQGHADDRHNLARLHLAFATARGTPANVIIKGPSSAGKNSLANAARAPWPDEVVIERSSMSPKALAYSEEDLRHRFIFLMEGQILQTSEGAYLIKTLISEGRIIHETVIDGKAERKEKEGPTGLISTTTRSFLDAEMETRCWTLETQVNVDHNRKAIRAIGKRFNEGPAPVDERLKAGLEFLLLAGDTVVEIPYAEWLAERVPASLPESKRLYKRLLDNIASCAFLYQRQRRRNPDGKIVANVADYAMTFGLFEDAFKVGTTGITEAQRRVLEAMQALAAETNYSDRQMRLREIAKKVGGRAKERGEKAGVNPATVKGHLLALKRHGYVHQEKEGEPWQLLNDPPEASGLPHPYTLTENFPELSASWIGPVTGKELTASPPRNPPNGPTATPASNTSPNTNGGVGSASQQVLGTRRSPTQEPNGSRPPDLHTKSSENGSGVGALGQEPKPKEGLFEEESRVRRWAACLERLKALDRGRSEEEYLERIKELDREGG